jgi:cytochrome c oxidase cbb3-type subunit I/II
VGALGWNGFLTFGMLYWLIPRLFKTELFSKKLANVHFWLGTLGIVFYALSMWWSGIAQASMWKEFTPLGTLQYPNFLETTLQIIPMYMIRATGGLLYFAGICLGVYN